MTAMALGNATGRPQGLDSGRRAPRFEVDAYVDVTGDDVLLYHRIQNISVGGICIQTAMGSEVGTHVDVILNFPELGAQLELRGKVVWANREPPTDVGIRWLELDDTRRDLLRMYIDLVKRRQISPRDQALA